MIDTLLFLQNDWIRHMYLREFTKSLSFGYLGMQAAPFFTRVENRNATAPQLRH